MSTPRQSRGRTVESGSRNTLWIGLAIVAVLVIIVVGIVLLTNTGGGSAAAEQQFPDEGRDHVAQTERVEYQTNPPTSGKHWPSTAPWTFFDKEAPQDENLVHNMEHGGVIIWYNPDKIQGDEYQKLFSVYQGLAQKNYRVILTVRKDLDPPIALTAWNYMLRLDSVDEAAINNFYDAHILNGPECVAKRCPQ